MQSFKHTCRWLALAVVAFGPLDSRAEVCPDPIPDSLNQAEIIACVKQLKNDSGLWNAFDAPIPLGSLQKDNELYEFAIPKDVPAAAREVLLYVWFASGYVAPTPGMASAAHWRIYTYDGTTKYSKYLLWFRYPQNAYGFNSDNLWLPLTKNRKVAVDLWYGGLPRSQGTNVEGWVWLIGYR